MAQGPDSLGGDMLIEGSAQCRRAGVEVDPAELGEAIPGWKMVRRVCSSRPRISG
jgi:hypothetical protein